MICIALNASLSSVGCPGTTVAYPGFSVLSAVVWYLLVMAVSPLALVVWHRRYFRVGRLVVFIYVRSFVFFLPDFLKGLAPCGSSGVASSFGS